GIAAWVRGNMGRLPERVPVHYGSNLQPDRWVSRGPGLLKPLVIGAVMVLFIAALDLYTARKGHEWASRQSKEVAEGFSHRGTRRLALSAEFFAAILIGAITLSPFIGPVAFLLMLMLALAFLLVMVITTAWQMRGMPVPAVAPNELIPGLVYGSKAEPSLWIPRGGGFGYTLNFAHPQARRTLLLLLLGLPVVIVLLAVLLPD
ncbi:MAG: DUF1648 domain-containing protein, partial [Archangium sp.]